MPEIRLENRVIPYTIIRTKKRQWSASLRVQDGEIVVHASPFMPEFLIKKFIAEKSPWIFKRLDDVNEVVSKRSYKTGQYFLFFGQKYMFQLVETPKVTRPRLVVVKSKFFGMVPPGISEKLKIKGLQSEIIRWYMKQSVDVFKEKSKQYAEALDMNFAKVVVKDMVSRWGSCSADQHLVYNWKLALAPVEVANYVVAHEISHLKHKHHQKTFWECVSKFDIEYRIHRSWLKKNGHTLRV